MFPLSRGLLSSLSRLAASWSTPYNGSVEPPLVEGGSLRCELASRLSCLESSSVGADQGLGPKCCGRFVGCHWADGSIDVG